MNYIINYVNNNYDFTYDNYLTNLINNIENRNIKRYEKFIKYTVIDDNFNKLVLYRDIIINIIEEKTEIQLVKRL